MQLTEEQKNVIRGIIERMNHEQVITFGGVAGCGKSTIISVLLEALSRRQQTFQAAAYTGKAANVLRKKGVSAKTIHSTIYVPYKDENDNTYWELASRFDPNVSTIDGFIIDEASMVSKEIHDDLVSFGKPIIYVGDHGQLEPIGTKFNVMANPMFKLETVHRNAGEIAHFAQHIRLGRPASSFDGSSKVQVVTASSVEDSHLSAVDQVIVAFNKTRSEINRRVRSFRKIEPAHVVQGEKVICLRNNRVERLFNGMQGIVTMVHKRYRFDFISDGMIYKNVKYDHKQFGEETNKFEFDQDANPFDYAYAITCHKAQGDQFGNVIVFEQRCEKWDHVRWAYTAASRAVNGLIWVRSEEYRPSYLD